MLTIPRCQVSSSIAGLLSHPCSMLFPHSIPPNLPTVVPSGSLRCVLITCGQVLSDLCSDPLRHLVQQGLLMRSTLVSFVMFLLHPHPSHSKHCACQTRPPFLTKSPSFLSLYTGFLHCTQSALTPPFAMKQCGIGNKGKMWANFGQGTWLSYARRQWYKTHMYRT